MSRLAEQYGISGNGLAKICRRLNIPYPARGWWARKAAGQKVKTADLPPATPKIALAVTITATPAPPANTPEVSEMIAQSQEAIAGIDVAATLRSAHPIVAGWMAENERRIAEARRDRSPYFRANAASLVWTDTDRRAKRILSALFKAAEKHGVKVIEENSVVYFVANGERIETKLREKLKRVRRPKTEDEKRWSSPNRDWTAELTPTGLLVFSIETHVPGLSQRMWTETQVGQLETRLGEILAAIITAGPILTQLRLEREEAERRRRAEEAERYRREEQRKLDDNRWRRFIEFAVKWREVDVAREFLAAVEAQMVGLPEGEEREAITSWLPWLRERVAQHDPLHEGVASIFRNLSGVTTYEYPQQRGVYG